MLLLLSSSMLLGIGYTTHFLLISQEGILVSDFCGSVLPCLHILHSPHMLPSSLLLSIFSLAGVCLWGAYSPPHNIPVSFPIQDIPVFFLAISFVVWPHVLPLLLFSSSFQPQYLGIHIWDDQSPNIWNISLPLLSFASLLLPLLSLHIVLLYSLSFQIYSEELTSSSLLFFYSCSYRPSAQTFYTPNIFFLLYLLFLPLVWQEHTVSWAFCS